MPSSFALPGQVYVTSYTLSRTNGTLWCGSCMSGYILTCWRGHGSGFFLPTDMLQHTGVTSLDLPRIGRGHCLPALGFHLCTFPPALFLRSVGSIEEFVFGQGPADRTEGSACRRLHFQHDACRLHFGHDVYDDCRLHFRLDVWRFQILTLIIKKTSLSS